MKYDLVTANGNYSRFVTMFVSIVSSVTYALSRVCDMDVHPLHDPCIRAGKLYRSISGDFQRRQIRAPGLLHDPCSAVHKTGQRLFLLVYTKFQSSWIGRSYLQIIIYGIFKILIDKFVIHRYNKTIKSKLLKKLDQQFQNKTETGRYIPKK